MYVSLTYKSILRLSDQDVFFFPTNLNEEAELNLMVLAYTMVHSPDILFRLYTLAGHASVRRLRRCPSRSEFCHIPFGLNFACRNIFLCLLLKMRVYARKGVDF